MKTKERYAYEPDYAVPPGATLAETIEHFGMTQRELAVRTGLTPVSVSRILDGEQPITYETANKLEMVTGVPARFWNNREAQYREQLAKIEERDQMCSDLDWLKSIPVKELQERKYVGVHQDKVLVLRNVLTFFGVSSVDAWKKIWIKPEVAARRSTCFETSPGPTSAWLRQGELRAQAIECEFYNETKFRKALKEIRCLSKEQASVFEPEMKRLCAEAGVAVVFVKEMKKVPWSGATRWLSPDKAMILMSLRGKKEDKFWFSFFHEAGHILLHSKKDLFIDNSEAEDEREKEANEFAAEFLIPEIHNDEICKALSFTKIQEIAKELGISPGIVAGRYQHLTRHWDRFNNLKRSLAWKSAQKDTDHA